MSILGGLLSGIGKGMETQALHNRELALENLRNQRQVETEGRLETREIAKEGRLEGRDDRAAARDHRNKVSLVNRSGEISAAAAQQDFKNKVTLTQISTDLDIRRDNNNAGNARALEKMRLDRDDGKVSEFVIDDETGNYVGLTNGGGRIDYGVKAQPKPLTESEQKARDIQAKNAKKYTQADAQATAKKYGISVDQVHEQMKAQGFRLQR